MVGEWRALGADGRQAFSFRSSNGLLRHPARGCPDTPPSTVPARRLAGWLQATLLRATAAEFRENAELAAELEALTPEELRTRAKRAGVSCKVRARMRGPVARLQNENVPVVCANRSFEGAERGSS